jgi:hypothetical protein
MSELESAIRWGLRLLVVQCSRSSADEAMLERLEPSAPSLIERMGSLRTLSDAGAHVQLRLWPFAPDLLREGGRVARDDEGCRSENGPRKSIENLSCWWFKGANQCRNRADLRV